MRTLLSWALMLTGLYLMLGLTVLLDLDRMPQWMERREERAREFRRKAAFIHAFKDTTGMFPTHLELVRRGYGPGGDTDAALAEFNSGVIFGNFPGEAVAAVGAPPSGGFILRTWNGDEYDYYASWNGKTTLDLDRSPGWIWRKIRDSVFLGILGAFIFVCGFALRRAHRKGPWITR